MGMMIDGRWEDTDTKEKKQSGHFERTESAFRHRIVETNTALNQKFMAETGRYHLFVSYACPWAHRAIIYRNILGLKETISMSAVHPVNVNFGWNFSYYPNCDGDPLFDSKYLSEIYAKADSTYTGKVTVPVLWDKINETIVNNESSDIMRMMSQEFKQFAKNWINLYPEALREKIDELNDFVYKHLNNGVYRTGFATSQKAYQMGVEGIFFALAQLNARLQKTKFLFGDYPLETDWRLFTTLIRFDSVYYFHFKCNLRKLNSYSNLSRYLRNLVDFPNVRDTIKLNHINDHYYLTHLKVNPNAIIPIGAITEIDDIF
jgi:putative glutathione S-transferase